MKRYVTADGQKFLIRGPYTSKELKTLFEAFLRKYPGTTTTFRGWLVGFGKVYFRVPN